MENVRRAGCVGDCDSRVRSMRTDLADGSASTSSTCSLPIIQPAPIEATTVVTSVCHARHYIEP